MSGRVLRLLEGSTEPPPPPSFAWVAGEGGDWAEMGEAGVGDEAVNHKAGS